MDEVLFALADPIRRRLLDRLFAENGQTLRALSGDAAITRQGMAKHLKLLEAAGLVVAKRAGREKLHFIRTGPLVALADGWMAQFRAGVQAVKPVEATGPKSEAIASARRRKRKDPRRNHLSKRERRQREKKRDDREAEEWIRKNSVAE